MNRVVLEEFGSGSVFVQDNPAKSLRILKGETRGLHDQDGSDPEFASRAVPAGTRSDPLGPALSVRRFDPYTGERLESAGPP